MELVHKGSMAIPGPGWGFQAPLLATQLTALKQDFILKLLKRTEMFHRDSCSRGGGSARGQCCFPTQDAVGRALGVSVHLCVCVCMCVSEGDKVHRGVCVHPSAERPWGWVWGAGFMGPTARGWNWQVFLLHCDLQANKSWSRKD